MLQFLSDKAKIYLVIFIFTLMGLLSFGLAYAFNIETTFPRLYSSSLTFTVFFIGIVKNTRLFLNLWHVEKWGIGKTLSEKIGVDLDGRYLSVFESNFDRAKDPSNTEITLNKPSDPRPTYIEVTWEKIVINMDGGERSSESSAESSPVNIKKDENGKITLEYLYKGNVPTPTSTDERYYDGAAKLSYKPKTGTLKGLYWTNRSYLLGINSAGRITLTKSS